MAIDHAGEGPPTQEPESFVILDDDPDMGSLSDRLVKCEFETGLTQELADRAIEMLRAGDTR